tara:strand:- start:14198 stop:14719 length:522 start_codon:yes stop_codon:yes gene_type:complete
MTPAALIGTLTRPWAHGAHAALAGAVFDAPVVLDGLALRGFDLSGAVFRQGLSARGTRFLGLSWFHGAQVTGALDLTRAHCRSDLRLDRLAADRLTLTEACFEGVLTLDHARLGTLSGRDCLCLANLSLAGTRIRGDADLSGAAIMGGLWAEGAELGRLDLRGAEIDGRRQGV